MNAANTAGAAERGNHALVFFSLVLGIAVTNLVGSWNNFLVLGIWRTAHRKPETWLLITISLLAFQYWWVLYQSATFYGTKLVFFVLGVIENSLLYGLTLVLGTIYSPDRDGQFVHVQWCFGLFALLIALFLGIDFLKPPSLRPDRLRLRQGLRCVAIVCCLVGLYEPVGWWMALAILVFMLVYMTPRLTPS